MTGTVVITGASGFIGGNLCAWFAGRGWSVRALVRSPMDFQAPGTAIETYHCDLPDRIDADALTDATAVIHCAYETRTSELERARATNEEGTRRLHELSRSAGVDRFVFLSSTAAHPGALSYYGRSKLAIEDRLDLGTDSVIRAGLVIGPGRNGLFHRMADSLRRTRLVPIVAGGAQTLQSVYIDDLATAIERVIDRGDTGKRVVAEADGLSVRDFFNALGERIDARPRFVPVPGRALVAALQLTERLRIPLPVTSENVLGMRSLRYQDPRGDLEALGITVRGARESLDLALRA